MGNEIEDPRKNKYRIGFRLGGKRKGETQTITYADTIEEAMETVAAQDDPDRYFVEEPECYKTVEVK